MPVAEKNKTDFKRVLLFKAGEFNGVKTTPQDLRDMVAFSKEHENIMPDLKIDHVDSKDKRDSRFKVFENFPFSLGKITNLEYDENERALYGDYINVFEPVKNALDDKLLTTHSAEIYYNVSSKKTGKKYKAVLTAVAILPAGKPPALMEVFEPYMYDLQAGQDVGLTSFDEFDYQEACLYQITDYPTKGEDQKISLYNTGFAIFDPDYAKDLKEKYPEIWAKGGNIEGNNQYRRLLPIVTRQNKQATTPTEEMAIKKREAWGARHLKDFRVPGVVAQIKWFVVGSRGEGYMKDLINQEKKKYKFSLEGKMDQKMYEAKMQDFGCGKKGMAYGAFMDLPEEEQAKYLSMMQEMFKGKGEKMDGEKEPQEVEVNFSFNDVARKNEELEKKLNSLMQAESKRAEALEARIAEYEKKAKSERVEKILFNLSGTDSVKLLPAVVDKARMLLMSADDSKKVSYSVDGGQAEKSVFDLATDLLNSLPDSKQVFSAKSIVASQDDVQVFDNEIKDGLSVDSVLASKKIAKKYSSENLANLSEAELFKIYANEGVI